MKSNWKMYGIWIGNFTIIPCYYDLLRYLRLFNFLKYKLNFIQFTTMWYRFECLFDASKPTL